MDKFHKYYNNDVYGLFSLIATTYGEPNNISIMESDYGMAKISMEKCGSYLSRLV